MTTAVPNGWCVVIGQPGKDPLTIVGGFIDEAEVDAHVAEHQRAHPEIPVIKDVLVDKRNC